MGAEHFFNKFFRWLVSSVVAFLIVLLLINVVMSMFVDLTAKSTIPNIVGTVYDFASPQAQSQIGEAIGSVCDNLQFAATRSRPNCLPENQESLRKICSSLSTLPSQNQMEYRASCAALADGSLQESCSQNLSEETQDISQSCAELSAGQITHKQFLTTVFSKLIAQQIVEGNSERAPQAAVKFIGLIQGYENQYLVWKLAAVALLFLLWFLVSDSASDFVRKVSRMFFSTGMFIFLIWLISIITITFFPPDTSGLLLSLTGSGSVEPTFSLMARLLPAIIHNLIGEMVLMIACAALSLAFALFLLRKYVLESEYVLAHLHLRRDWLR